MDFWKTRKKYANYFCCLCVVFAHIYVLSNSIGEYFICIASTAQTQIFSATVTVCRPLVDLCKHT